ncbi:MAG: neuromedin U [Alphaproteobacteria bacterium]|nr:neuromedin U [Alphaproteobacteria bacterium]
MSYKKQKILFCMYLYIFLVNLYMLPACRSSNLEILKGSENPLSNTIVLPFRDNLNFEFLGKPKPQDLLQIEPQLPIKLTEKIKVVVRPILPVFYQINTATLKGHVFGLGDLNPQFYFSSTVQKTFSIGFGPAFAFPTATNSQIGTGKVSAGPAIVFAAMPKNWVLGFYANNLWSFAGSRNRPSVNVFNLSGFVYYNLSNDWFLASTPGIAANWKISGSEQWIVPVGGGIGRLFKINNQYIAASIQYFYNALVPSSIKTKWSLRFSLDFVFPEKDPFFLPF